MLPNAFWSSFPLAAGACVVATTALAVEGGSGVYLLGSKGSGAGILPPAGTYFLNDSYYYSGSASASTALPDEAGMLGLLSAMVVFAVAQITVTAIIGFAWNRRPEPSVTAIKAG